MIAIGPPDYYRRSPPGVPGVERELIRPRQRGCGESWSGPAIYLTAAEGTSASAHSGMAGRKL